MRIHFATINRAKKLAKGLRAALEPEPTVVDEEGDPKTLAPKTMTRILAGLPRFTGAPTTRPVSLSLAQTILAEITGYKDWHELATVTATAPAPTLKLSADDARHYLTRAMAILQRDVGCSESFALAALATLPITDWEDRFFLIAPMPTITTSTRLSVPSWNPSEPPTLEPWYGGRDVWPILPGTQIRVRLERRPGEAPKLRPVDGRHRIIAMTATSGSIPITCLHLLDAPTLRDGRTILSETFGREVPIDAFDLSPSS